jgi:gliding motility-associated lipoprotein GldH
LKRTLHILFFLFLVACLFFSCTPIDLYEKTVAIPRHEWQNSFRPSFSFVIKDTSVPYKIVLVLRHNEKYNYNNIYVNLYIKRPGQDTAVKFQRDLLLATNEEGWLGSGIDDIYEHRLKLAENERLEAGMYTFTIEQIMREDPLQNVLNVGLRLEKQNR